MLLSDDRVQIDCMDNVNAFTAPTVSTSDAHVSAAQPAIFASRFLRIEGLLLLLVSSVAYRHLGGSWALFAVLFLVPDVSLLGYLGGARFGAWAYNLGHSTLLPLLLAGLGWFVSAPMLLLLALIWTAHIGFDRLMGYGLKQTSGFRDTHLGRIGHDA